MRRARALLLATLTAATVLAVLVPTAQSQMQNRLPHAILGPDQTVGDSDDAPLCAPPAELAGCRRIDFNFNQSWDPDPGDDLTQAGAFTWTISATPDPHVAGSQCELVAPPAAPPPAYLAPIAGEPGKYYTYAPIINDPAVASCLITIAVTVDDGNSVGSCCLPPPNNCCVTEEIRVRVMNGNDPPQFDCTPDDTCAATALTIDGVLSRQVDLVADRDTDLVFRAQDLRDDRLVTSVQVYLDLYGDSDQLVHRLIVPLNKCVYQGGCTPLVVPCCSSPGQPEVSTWTGRLPVNTPELITGSYTVWARALDGQGLNDTYPMGEIRLEVESEGGQCRIPQADGTLGTPPCIHLNRTQKASNIPSACFAGEAEAHMNVLPLPPQRLSFGLGHGDTLRPIIEAPYPTEGNPPVVLQEPNLLLRKVTYQTCVETDFGPVYGPEVAMDPPYYLALDTLFTSDGCAQAASEGGCDQDIALRAYDRLGAITGVAFHLVTDTARPEFLVARPPVTYLGIPFHFNILVHDRIDTEVALRIDRFEAETTFTNRTLSDTQSPRGNVSVSNVPWLELTNCPMDETRCTVGELNVVRIPKLQNAIRYDVGGRHDGSSDCDYLFDTNGDGVLDTAFDGRGLGVKGKLLPTASDDESYNDYVLDADGDLQLTPDEPFIPGLPTGGIADANRCEDPFESDAVRAFLNAGATQVFSYTLTRNTLGTAPYRITIRDTFGNEAPPYYAFNYLGGRVNSTLVGKFTTDRALVDASILALNVSAGPFLVGDSVWVNATVAQHSDQGPVEPSAPMVVGIDEVARIECSMQWQAAELLGYFEGIPPECLQDGNTAYCRGTLNNTIPVQSVQTKCYTLYPPEFAGLNSFLQLILNLPLEPQREGCAVPDDQDHEHTICMQRPDLQEPIDARDRELRLPFGPGKHELAAYVLVLPTVNDTEEYDALAYGLKPNNYMEAEPFEVFLGRVVHGKADEFGRATGSAKEYYIRAGANGRPLLDNGAVKVDDAGKVVAAFDLTFNQSGSAVRYEFSPDGGATKLYWERDAKMNVDGTLCGFNATTTGVCQRPVTVVSTNAQTTSSSSKESSAVAVVLPVVLVALALLARRKRLD